MSRMQAFADKATGAKGEGQAWRITLVSPKHPLAEITPSHDFQTLETTSSNDFMSDTVASV